MYINSLLNSSWIHFLNFLQNIDFQFRRLSVFIYILDDLECDDLVWVELFALHHFAESAFAKGGQDFV